ncbi:MAG TPA: PDZ domain-containing protein [Gaiellaceae bacterium]|jgi:PDZ domain-containing protein|nr:PDZ domain-containing protein [Gaiellaceae bacterium]
MRFLSAGRAAAAAVLLAAVVLVALYLIPSDKYYVFVPDRAHELAPLVEVAGQKATPASGGVYFVDVRFRKARLLEDLLGRPLARGATMEPTARVLGDTSEKEQRRIDLNQMAQSQKTAAAIALNRLGYHVRITLPQVVIQGVVPRTPAAKVLRPRDVLVSVDGTPVHTVGRLHGLLAEHKPGDRLVLVLRRGGETRTVATRTVPDDRDRAQAVVGIFVREVGGSIGKLPVNVRIDTGGVGGPSAGLAFALDLMEEFGRNVDRGYKVAATGELELDGSVVPIGAIKQKTIGAREAGVDVFLVPAGSNARDARNYAQGLRIIPVQTFPQALLALTTLPLKGRMNA